MEQLIKYKNIQIISIPTEKFPTMVQLHKGPKKYKGLIGKKYITKDHAVMAIDEMAAENLIRSGGKSVESELVALGLKGIGDE